MPPKDLLEDFLPELCVQYPDGHYEKIGKIKEVELTPDPYDDLSPEAELIMKPSEMTIQFKWNPDIRTEILLITGKAPSNNWLRMHGYPMTRRCGYRKRKRANENSR